MKKKILVLLISMMCAMFLSGCELKQPKICVTMYPIQYLVDKIGGDRVTCTTIGDGNIAIRSHINADWQEQLSDADLFLYVSEKYTNAAAAALYNGSEINYTFQNFGRSNGILFDYCFFRGENVVILAQRIANDIFDGYVSDHYGLVTDVFLS